LGNAGIKQNELYLIEPRNMKGVHVLALVVATFGIIHADSSIFSGFLGEYFFQHSLHLVDIPYAVMGSSIILKYGNVSILCVGIN
jgi:hypothetical protein